ncbi:MAG: hypothetical protein WCL18_10090 [bacterium]
MKNIIIAFVCCCMLLGSAFAYTPSSQDVAQVTLLKTQLDTITTGNIKGKWDFYAQLKTLQEQYATHEQLNYYLNELALYLITQVNTEKTKIKLTSKTTKQDFVNIYSG